MTITLFTRAKLERELKKTDERLDRYLGQMDEADADDPGASAAAPDLQGKIAAIRKRRATLKAHRETLEESGREQLSLTDPDSRVMKTAKGYYKIGDIEACEAGGVTAHVPKPVRSPSKIHACEPKPQVARITAASTAISRSRSGSTGLNGSGTARSAEFSHGLK